LPEETFLASSAKIRSTWILPECQDLFFQTRILYRRNGKRILAGNQEKQESGKNDANPNRTFFGMRMNNMNILSKNVMRYGHILRQDLMPFGELKFLNFLFYRLIFLLKRLNFYLSVSVIKELFQFIFSFTFKMSQL
jgi:hypothetical protein